LTAPTDWPFIDYTQSKALPITNRSRAITELGAAPCLKHPAAPLIKPCWLPGKLSLRQPRNPIIKKQCLQQAPELLPRFAEHYQQIRALRRRLRRSLQRQWKRSLAGLALLIALGQAPALVLSLLSSL
jgi:hypothetical protein